MAWGLVLGALTLTACGGAVDDELASESDALTVDFTYHCTSSGASDVWVYLKGSQGTLAHDPQLASASRGSYDSAYKPRTRKDMVRYLGFADWDPPGTTNVLVDKTLRSGGAALRGGGKGGALIVESIDHGYSSTSYDCRAVAKPAAGGTQALGPFTLQWIGVYTGPRTVTRLELKRDGTYAATVSGRSEKGTFQGNERHQYPLVLQLKSSTGTSWTASVGGYMGALDVVRGSTHVTLQGAAQSEEACDRSGGQWTDDDADAASGLFCVCPAGKVLVWSAGGCVR